jgi:hypothetical protein
VSTSVSESARWPEMDELPLQHPARTETKRQSPRSARPSGQHATQRMSRAPASHSPLSTTSMLPLQRLLTCYIGAPCNHGQLRRKHTSQPGRCSGQVAHRRPFTPPDPAGAHAPMSTTIHRSSVLPATCTTAFGHSASRRHASPTRYPSDTLRYASSKHWLPSNGD